MVCNATLNNISVKFVLTLHVNVYDSFFKIHLNGVNYMYMYILFIAVYTSTEQ